jgi:hypothetical protein
MEDDFRRRRRAMKKLTAGLAAIVLTMGMAAVAGADGFYWPRSQDSETSVMETVKGEPELSQARGPVETGALPDGSDRIDSGFYWPRSQDSETSVMEPVKGESELSQARGPVETGALPDGSDRFDSGFYWPRMQDSETTTGG